MKLIKEYSIWKEEDYHSINVSMTEGTEPIVDNQYYIDSNSVAHVKSEDGTAGYFKFPLPGLEVGDVIEAECDVRLISGDPVRIGVDDEEWNKLYRETEKVGEWETIKIKYICYNDMDHSVSFGTWTNMIGEFYLKNIKIRTHVNKTEILKYRKYQIEKRNGSWIVNKNLVASDGATVTEVSTENIRITHDVPLTGRYPIVLVNGNLNANLYDITPVAGYASRDKFEVKFMRADGTPYILTDLPDGLIFSAWVVSD